MRGACRPIRSFASTNARSPTAIMWNLVASVARRRPEALTCARYNILYQDMPGEPVYSNAVDAITTRLRSEILTGRLASGSRLRQDAIAADCGVSHVPVREALRRLEAEGLVSIRPRHGAAVASLSAGELEELYEMRVALEYCAIRAVIKNASVQELHAAEAILDEIDRQPDRWAELNTAFHITLYRAAHRPRLLATLEPIIRGCERYLHHEVSVVDNFKVSQREHRELLRTIRRRDAKGAYAILKRHLEHPGAKSIASLRAMGLE